MDTLKRLVSWAARNERHLGAVLFIFGFITDLFTFAYLSVSLVNLAFIGYLTLATLATLGSHLFSEAREHPTLWRRMLAVLFPLAAQYAIGSLLSGCLIFYGKSATVLVSWPFLLILAAVFIGNEYFRTYYKHLAFQVVLLFFALYAYSIFALPIYIHQLGTLVFLGSTLIALVLFAGFLYILSRLHRPGFRKSLRYVYASTGLILVLMVGSYFLGLIPPIPLALSSAGIYHNVRHVDGQYVVALENDSSWWHPTQVIHYAPGTPLFAYSAVSAPFDFSQTVVHVWEYYSPTQKKWVQRNKVTFQIAGGRDGGYRGYSEVFNLDPGKWRVTIETPSKQVIGRLYFTVEAVDTPPLIKEEPR